MKKRTNHKRNLVISVLIALLGIVFIIASFGIFDFRHSGGWSFINQTNNLIISVTFYLLSLLELVLGLLGLFVTILSGISIYNNAKKMR